MEIRIKINDRLVQFVRGLFSRRVFPFLLAVVLLGGTVTLLAEPFVIPFVFSTGEVISSSQMNTNFEQVGERINTVQTQVDSLVASGGSVWSASAPHIYYDGGNVGIGTSSPSSLLHLYSVGADVGLRVESADVGYDPNITLGYLDDSNVKLWRDVPGDSLKLDAGGATRMTIDPSGKVGIGTMTPATQLEVDGVITAPLMMSRVVTVGVLGGTGTVNTSVSTSTYEAFIGGISDQANVSHARHRYWVYASGGSWYVNVNYEDGANVNVKVRLLFIRKEMFSSVQSELP